MKTIKNICAKRSKTKDTIWLIFHCLLSIRLVNQDLIFILGHNNCPSVLCMTFSQDWSVTYSSDREKNVFYFPPSQHENLITYLTWSLFCQIPLISWCRTLKLIDELGWVSFSGCFRWERTKNESKTFLKRDILLKDWTYGLKEDFCFQKGEKILSKLSFC